MKKAFILVSLLSTFLIGCSSTSPHTSLEQFETYTGGQVMGDATSFYWVTNQSTQAHTSADYVIMGDYGWYKTDYVWSNGILREFVREGEQRNASIERVPYHVHVRFNKSGEAVYQQYRLGSKVLPIQTKQLENYQAEARSVLETVREQNDEGLRMIQGYWNGHSFDVCSEGKLVRFEFNQPLPSFATDSLAPVKSYAAFLGSNSRSNVTVKELLMLGDGSHDCVTRPSLLKK
ncbi:DUF1481 domain-containing protein [Vibrio artabrorum]|uniref:DUF1481 domain-containing protein n=1 Tax=Vibrio artabrorum TaxID=446374 RepID=UPI00354BB7E6